MSTACHVVRMASSSDALEILLDNAANRNWSLVTILPFNTNGATTSFWVIFNKQFTETEDD